VNILQKKKNVINGEVSQQYIALPCLPSHYYTLKRFYQMPLLDNGKTAYSILGPSQKRELYYLRKSRTAAKSRTHRRA
jgi:hypothetical protein